MQTAEVRISDNNFGERLKDMRLWLDERRFEPLVFTYFYLDPGKIVRVSFEAEHQASAFAQEFGGSLINKEATVRPLVTKDPARPSLDAVYS